jgi:hypothetical protein
LAVLFFLTIPLFSLLHSLDSLFFLLLPVKSVSFSVVTASAKCASHFAEFGLFGSSTAVRVRLFEAFRRDIHTGQAGEHFLTQSGDLFFDLVLIKSFFFQFELQLEAFDLYFSFPLVLKNSLVWFSVLGRSSTPGRLSVLCTLV